MAKKSFKSLGFASDSAWEEKLKQGIFKDLKYHPCKLPYIIEHTYQPDWVIHTIDYDYDQSGMPWTIYIEAKGIFRTSAEMAKYVAIKTTLKPDEELVFLFMKPNAPIYFKAKRKDGTKMTHAQWAEFNKFRWFDETTIKDLLKECGV